MTQQIRDLDIAFGPCDDATAELIAASIVMHSDPRVRAAALAELDRDTVRLKMGVAEFARRVRAVERRAGVRR
jgi:hypothetical protein